MTSTAALLLLAGPMPTGHSCSRWAHATRLIISGFRSCSNNSYDQDYSSLCRSYMKDGSGAPSVQEVAKLMQQGTPIDRATAFPHFKDGTLSILVHQSVCRLGRCMSLVHLPLSHLPGYLYSPLLFSVSGSSRSLLGKPFEPEVAPG